MSPDGHITTDEQERILDRIVAEIQDLIDQGKVDAERTIRALDGTLLIGPLAGPLAADEPVEKGKGKI